MTKKLVDPLEGALPTPVEGASSLDHVPKGPWVFDEAVTACFSDMLVRSIPGLSSMRELVFELASRYLTPEGLMIDVGASTGETTFPLALAHPKARFWAVEHSPSMLESLRATIDRLCIPNVRVMARDMRVSNESAPNRPGDRADVIAMVLTLQFISPVYRMRILEEAFRWLKPGGALIIVEKVLGDLPELEDLFRGLHEDFKARKGYSQEAIARKKLSLEGQMITLTASDNERRIHQAGFYVVECFWRHLNFVGWLAVKR